MDPAALVAGHGATLTGVAEAAIRARLEGTDPPDLSGAAPVLWDLGAAFVTLEEGDRLLGCVGSIQAHRPLVVDVAERARAAAFGDPRFDAVDEAAFAAMRISVSVLSGLEPVPATSFDDLLRRLRPGTDGLVVAAGVRRATFLPSVWDKLPTAELFVNLLWRKASLAVGAWPDGLVLQRYTTACCRADPPRQPVRLPTG
jgi:AmmeMemoRadiSam system protein A